MEGPNQVSEETILKAMHGDEEAFTKIYKFYYKRVYFMGVQYFKNEDKAMDIVQEVFIKVHQQIARLQSPKAFSSWLHVITYRECHNQYKRKSRVIELRGDEHIEDFADINEINIVDLVENERVRETIMVSLDTMSTQLRMVGVMRFFDELKIEEIADVLDIPKSTVSSQLQKIKKILENDLKKEGFVPTASYSLLIFSPHFLYEIYEKLSDKYSVSESVALDILQKVMTGTVAAKSGSAAMLPKFLIGGLTSAVVIGIFISLHQNPSPATEEPIADISPPLVNEEPKEELATIESVTYNTEWTNEKIEVDVKTSSSNYDALLINDSESLYIVENGTYHIQLIKDGQIIDEKIIVISNIDIESPYGISERDGNTFTIQIYDDVSGVDPNSIIVLRNGVPSNDYTYDVVKNVLVITTHKSYNDTIYIYDYAGNVFEIHFE